MFHRASGYSQPPCFAIPCAGAQGRLGHGAGLACVALCPLLLSCVRASAIAAPANRGIALWRRSRALARKPTLAVTPTCTPSRVWYVRGFHPRTGCAVTLRWQPRLALLALTRKGGRALRPPSPRGVAPSLLAQPPSPHGASCSHAQVTQACRFAGGARAPLQRLLHQRGRVQAGCGGY